MLQQYLLQFVFLLGAFLQTFFFLRHTKRWKLVRVNFYIWLFMMGWFLFMNTFMVDMPDIASDKTLMFGVIIWMLLVSISFFKEWFPHLDLSFLLMHTLTLWYVVAAFVDPIYFFPGILFSFLGILFVHYIVSRVISWYAYSYDLCFLGFFVGIDWNYDSGR